MKTLITTFIHKYSHKINAGLMVVFGSVLIMYLTADSVVAANEQLSELANSSINLLHLFLVAISTLLGLITSLAGLFLTPEWTSGSVFGINNTLESLWVLVSNVVYLVFAGIFVAIALMNIIGKGEGDWALKQALPRFFIAGLFIPFSLLFVKLLVSIANILMVSVISLPYDTMSDKQLEVLNTDKNICKHVLVKLNAEKSEDMIGCYGGEASKQNLKEFYQEGLFGLMHIYIYGILNVQNIDKLLINNQDSVEGTIVTFGQLTLKMVFDVVFVLVYLVLIISILMVLFVRGIMLWLYIVISPLFALQIFFGKSNGGEGAFSKFSIKGFIGLALVPVYVGLALGFGLMFMVIVSQIGIKADSDKDEPKPINVAGFTYDFRGYQSNAEEKEGGDGTSQSILYGAKDSVSFLILQIFGIVFLWMAVMAALKQSDITQAIVKPVEQMGGSIKDIALKLPQHAPIIPSKDGSTNTSLSGLRTSFGKLEAYIDTKTTQKSDQWAQNNGLGFLVEGTKHVTNLRLAMNAVKNNYVNNGKITNVAEFLAVMKKYNIDMNNYNYPSVRSNPQLRSILIDSSLFEEEDFDSVEKYNAKWRAIHNQASTAYGKSIFELGDTIISKTDNDKMFKYRFSSDEDTDKTKQSDSSGDNKKTPGEE